MRRTSLPALLAVLALAGIASPALADSSGGASPTGGAAPSGGATPSYSDSESPPTAAAATLHRGIAHAPAGAPQAVQLAIAAANRIRHKPYVWGGGHGSWRARGYDCSGAVSYVLHAADLIKSPEVSGALASWGRKGRGDWITVYANSGHAYMVIAGLRYDTSGPGQSGPRWRGQSRSSRGFRVRHPRGL